MSSSSPFGHCFVCTKLTKFTYKGCQYIMGSTGGGHNDVALCVGKEPFNISGLMLHGRSSFDLDVIAHPKWGVIDCYFIYGITARIGSNRTGIEQERSPFLRYPNPIERATMTVLSTSNF